MSFAPDRKPIVNMTALFEQIKKLTPKLSAFASMKECVRISNQDHGITSSGEEDIQTLRRRHESNFMVRIASRESDDDNITLFSLVIVCRNETINQWPENKDTVRRIYLLSQDE